ncbi:MAG: hypothetical protein SGPRY_010634 [Prymnesium sp.]
MGLGDWAIFVPLSNDRSSCSGAASLASDSANGGPLSEGLTTTLRLAASTPVYALCIARQPFEGAFPRDAEYSYHPHVTVVSEEPAEVVLTLAVIFAALACCCCCWLLFFLAMRKRKEVIDKGTITGHQADKVDVGKRRLRRTRLRKPSTASKGTMTDETGAPPGDSPTAAPVDVNQVKFGMRSATIEDDGLTFDVDEDDEQHLVRHLTKRPSTGGGKRRESEEHESKLSMRPTRDKPPSSRRWNMGPYSLPPEEVLPPFEETKMNPVWFVGKRSPADERLEA